MTRSNRLQRIFFILFIADFFLKPAHGADISGSSDGRLQHIPTASGTGARAAAFTPGIYDAVDSMLALQTAAIYAPGHSMAAKVLKEEVGKRTDLQWPVVTKLPAAGPLIILKEKKLTLPFSMAAVPELPARPEAFRLAVQHVKGRTVVIIEGYDNRGVMFGVGQLLRLLLTFDAIDEEHLNWRQHSRVTEVWLIKK